MCIDPDPDSDVVIEEGEGDFRERCVIGKGKERNIEEEVEQADDEQSEQLTEAGTEPGMSLTTVPCQWSGSSSKIIKTNSYVRHNFI